MKKYLLSSTHHRIHTDNTFNTLDSFNNTSNILGLNSFTMKFRKTNKMKLNLPIKQSMLYK